MLKDEKGDSRPKENAILTKCIRGKYIEDPHKACDLVVTIGLSKGCAGIHKKKKLTGKMTS